MDLEQQLSDLSKKYSLGNIKFKTDEQIPNLEVCLQLHEEHIKKFIQKAGQLKSIVESCANMVTIFDQSVSKDLLMKTSLRCAGSDRLYIRTTSPMLKILVETLLD